MLNFIQSLPLETLAEVATDVITVVTVSLSVGIAALNHHLKEA